MEAKHYWKKATSGVLAGLLLATLGSCSSKTTVPPATTTMPITTPAATTTTTVAPPSTTTTTTPPTTTPRAPTTTPVVTTPAKKVIFADDFNSETTGATPSKWTVNKPTGTDVSIDDTVFSGTGGKSAKMQDSSPTESPSVKTIIDVQRGTFWYEVSIRLAQTNQIVGAAYLGSSTAPGGQFGIENLGVSVTFWSDGYLKYNDNDNDLLSWKNVQTYQADKWYSVKVLVDVPNQRINLYVDNVLKLSDIRFRYPVTSLDQISFGGRVELPALTFWIDNVLVTEGP